MTPNLADHFFRHEYGQLVAVLTRKVGAQHLDLVEDSVQRALLKAVDQWFSHGEPSNPSAWLYRVALNNLIGELRQRQKRDNILERAFEQLSAETSKGNPSDEPLLSSDIHDDMLRMLFVCCHGTIPVQSQLILALKTLCGFDVREIGLVLFMSEASVYKRLARAKAIIKHEEEIGKSNLLESLDNAQLSQRRGAVSKVLYLLFTEGYLSSHKAFSIRLELCDEAIRLAFLLLEHPQGQVPEVCALMALMQLHRARAEGRQDEAGDLLLLEQQDRNLWDQKRIRLATYWLAKSAEGEQFSRYHAEAAIAMEHCKAASFQETHWRAIEGYYAMLERGIQSPIHRLNRAVAMAEWQGPQAGLALLKDYDAPLWLASSYQWHCVLADLYLRSENKNKAREHCELALALAPNQAQKNLLSKRWGFKRSLPDG